MPRTLAAAYVASILQILESLGFPGETSRKMLAVTEDDLENIKVRVSLNAMTKLFNCAAAQLGYEDIGIRIGEKFRVISFLTTGTVLAHCATIADAARINGRYQPLVESVGRSNFVSSTQGDFMTWEITDADQQTHRHVAEMILAGYAITTHWLAWSVEGDVVDAAFMHEGPVDTSYYETVFGCPVRFGAERNHIQFADGLAQTQLPSYSPEKLATVQKKLDLVMAKFEGAQHLRETLSLTMIAAIKDGNVSELAVAERLKLSVRQLQKSLKSEGLTYRSVLDQTRKEMCLGYMKDARTLAEIAQILGYNDQAAFTKAFKRWYGLPPSKYRSTHIHK